MQYKSFPNGEKIPVLGLGTWQMGGGMYPNYSQDEKVINAVRTAIEVGYTHLDTAEMYADGHTEELIRVAIQQAKVARQNLFITSKVWHTNLRYRDVHKALNGTLERLGTDYLDLYLIHWPNNSIPLEETFKALNELVDGGKVRHLGVSNFDLPKLKQARELCATPLAANQVPYSLHNREYENNGVLSYCQESGILFTAYTPIEKGRVRSDPALQQIAQNHEATPIQVALNWLIRKPNVITIPMSTNPDHIKENLTAVDIELTDEELEKLEKIIDR